MADYFAFKGVDRLFDVSPSFLKRILSGAERKYLRAADEVTFAIRKGETLSLVGESGCGKSTVARMAVGIYRPTTGDISFEGKSLSDVRSDAAARHKINMIFQDPYSSLDPRWRVKDIIAEPIRTFRLLRTERKIIARVHGLLESVGLTASDGDRYPHEFSGGQRQRISIARALASEAEFLICDEPTSALDVSVQAQILNLMKDLQKERGLTYLFISHNIAVVRFISDRVAVMYLGRIVEIGDSETVLDRPLHPYTRMLFDALPDVTKRDRMRMPIMGEVPNPIYPPSGCTFHPRCPLANERCRNERPARLMAHGREVACHAVQEGRIDAMEDVRPAWSPGSIRHAHRPSTLPGAFTEAPESLR
jgi:peptide/nickel transport system ATP-binding protein